mmetsp:Transcript_31413/g.54507  ORF Transcript_31413/g.54507 Transcript_31413/m.54507 type:complete len:106 (+) Transcript_31413:168-485(+)
MVVDSPRTATPQELPDQEEPQSGFPSQGELQAGDCKEAPAGDGAVEAWADETRSYLAQCSVKMTSVVASGGAPRSLTRESTADRKPGIQRMLPPSNLRQLPRPGG